MITLITGTPGAGKTLYAVAEELPKYCDRTLFVDGIPDLLLNHEEFAGTPDSWHEWAPDGSVLVIDECQRVWRPRGAATKVPESVAAMETHRHKGIDIVLITQHPNLLDPNIRRLVGRHIHVRRMFGWKRAVIYEWDSATDPARVSTAIKRTWKYPKKAFSTYKSASLHTARGNRTPMVIFIAAIAIIAVPIAFYYAIHRTVSKINGDDNHTAATEPAKARGGNGNTVQPATTSLSAPKSIIDASVPTDPYNPLSAPLYADVQPVVVAPQVIGCVAFKNSCQCYTQQATRVFLPPDQCRLRVSGQYYDPYKQNPVVAERDVSKPPVVSDEKSDKTKPADGSVVPDKTPDNVEPMHWETNVTNI